MLDTKKVGIKIASMRKKIGYSQERLAQILSISPQAISKWENGHTLPETSLLPVIAQIFNCTIDEIIMPAYLFDGELEREKSTLLDQQAEHIAKHVMEKLEKKMTEKDKSAYSDDTLIDSVSKIHGWIGNCTVAREKPVKSDGNATTKITVSSQQQEFKLIEKIYGRNDTELHRYALIRQYTTAIPRIYRIDLDKKAILLENLSEDYIQGFDFNEDNENGNIIRSNHQAILNAVAELHAVFWDNRSAFEQFGLEWRLDSKENMLAHISAMEKDFRKYRKNEESGKIAKSWEAAGFGKILKNNINVEKLDYFEDAIRRLKNKYPVLIDSRFHAGKNITVIHGDLHPGQTLISKSAERVVKFTGFQAARMGLCTEDLAMLIALHIEPDKKKAQPLLDDYYHCLCRTAKDYAYETFINDYKISIMENMFFTIRLINQGIFDFNMRDKAIKAFETFVLGTKQ